jgi:hypothetical protein
MIRVVQEIDAIMFQRYGLTEEAVRIVEGSAKGSEP